ncbi:hypothetical protein BZG36_02089 [Bifiguratus adelaidae]|uniref:Peptidase S8/S53 domain-containing protein n=1 Tax=Bifiguratus adelaidae TaxID=1938954 RepID=A0A261Y393_9FUNG|nr:hypothetical protein BZG36_02089 [Bifiguratus adelaidae]
MPFIYSIGSFHWYHTPLTTSEEHQQQIRALPEVAYVQPDVMFHLNVEHNWGGHVAVEPSSINVDSRLTSATTIKLAGDNVFVQQHPPSWGLDRIDQNTGEDAIYHFDSLSGAGSTVYIVDTGVNPYHVDLVNRVSIGPTFVGNGSSEDWNGHGTFVGGVCCGTQYGVAKNASIISVKSLNADGSGSLSNVLQALNWVNQDVTTKNIRGKAIVNLSLGADYNQPTNDAIEAMIASGIHFAIAAGNDGGDACSYSPASVVNATTVGATNIDDTIAAYSNTGKCVDIFAPGSGIVAPWAGPNTTDATLRLMSGTSMASPHVAGVMALFAAAANYTPIEMNQKLKSIASIPTQFNKTAPAWKQGDSVASANLLAPNVLYSQPGPGSNIIFKVGQASAAVRYLPSFAYSIACIIVLCVSTL